MSYNTMNQNFIFVKLEPQMDCALSAAIHDLLTLDKGCLERNILTGTCHAVPQQVLLNKKANR